MRPRYPNTCAFLPDCLWMALYPVDYLIRNQISRRSKITSAAGAGGERASRLRALFPSGQYTAGDRTSTSPSPFSISAESRKRSPTSGRWSAPLAQAVCYCRPDWQSC
jgi:hypothetical protein